MALDRAFKFGAGRYIQQPDALSIAGEEIAAFGKKIWLVGGPTALSLTQEKLEVSLKKAGLEYEFCEYGGYNTMEKCEEFGTYCRENHFDVVVGVGGGKIMDLCKGVAHQAGLPVVTIPTQAATCAAYTPMSVLYRENGAAFGTVGGNYYHMYEVSLLIIDETIMIHQPPRYVASGMLDVMAKFIEIQNGHPDIQFNTFNVELYTAYVLAKYIYGVLESTALKVYSDVENHILSKEVHDFLFINFAVTGMISGISKALGQTALAHEMYYVVRMNYTQEAKEFLHGEIVGACLIMQLVYNRQADQVPAFKKFMRTMHMPTALREMGIPETEENKQQIYNYLKDTIFVEDTPENKQALWNSVLAICE